MSDRDETTRVTGEQSERLLADRYELRGLLGQGGMADVELAYDTQLDRLVAVKILHARYASDDSFLARFRREAQHAAQLNHPNIVAVYDTGEHENRPFIVMEYVTGRSLKELVDREGLLTERAAEITGDAALGLHYAHDRGLVHRDIKPANIMLDDEGRVKVADFGIARAVNAETVTQTAAVFGTAAYIAPEQAQGEEVDRRTDIYALGCVLYEMLTGRQPFYADSAVALAYKHVSAEPSPPSQLNPDVTPELEAVVMRMMSKDPARRYDTAREVTADLQRAIAGQPVAAQRLYSYEETQALGQTAAVAPTEAVAYEEPYEDAYEEEPRKRRSAGMWILLAVLILALLAVGGFLVWNFLTAEEPPETAVIPNVVGMHFQDAQSTLIDAGFLVEFEWEESDEVEPNHVIDTDPEVGEELELGETVMLYVSEGPPLVAVPDVVGMDEDAARAAITEAGLVVGDRSEQPDEDAPEGEVLQQSPSAGQEVPEETAVDLVVSSGPPDVLVPNVVNLPEDQAISQLEGACDPEPCFDVQISREFSDEIPEDRVIRQSPEPNTEASRGSQVAIVVSRGPDEPDTAQVPNVVGMHYEDAQDLLGDAGFSVEVEREQSDEVAADHVIESDPDAGTELEIGSTVVLLVSDGPPPDDEEGGPDDG